MDGTGCFQPPASRASGLWSPSLPAKKPERESSARSQGFDKGPYAVPSNISPVAPSSVHGCCCPQLPSPSLFQPSPPPPARTRLKGQQGGAKSLEKVLGESFLWVFGGGGVWGLLEKLGSDT